MSKNLPNYNLSSIIKYPHPDANLRPSKDSVNALRDCVEAPVLRTTLETCHLLIWDRTTGSTRIDWVLDRFYV